MAKDALFNRNFISKQTMLIFMLRAEVIFSLKLLASSFFQFIEYFIDEDEDEALHLTPIEGFMHCGFLLNVERIFGDCKVERGHGGSFGNEAGDCMICINSQLALSKVKFRIFVDDNNDRLGDRIRW